MRVKYERKAIFIPILSNLLFSPRPPLEDLKQSKLIQKIPKNLASKTL